MVTCRYYNQTSPEIYCRRCKNPGHYESCCPYPFKLKCQYCLGPHYDSQCPNYLCFVCSEHGHKNIECQRRRERRCQRCQRQHQGECGKLWIANERIRRAEIEASRDRVRCCVCGWENHANCGGGMVDDLYYTKKQEDNDDDEDFVFVDVNE